MIIDNPAAFSYLFSDDIYLIKKDLDNIGKSDFEPLSLDASVPEPVTVQKELDTIEPVVIQTPVSHFEYTGKNQKQFLIICSYANGIDDKHLAALTSTLQRKELTVDDVAIVNMATYTTATTEQLLGYFKPERLLILGNNCVLPGWDSFKLNQLENLNGIRALYTYSFTEMMGDRDKTKAFWEQMKVL